MQLRPLGLGELLDRAVTLCVRHASTFALIFLVFIVPVALVQAFALPDQTALWNQLLEMAKSGGKVVPSAATSQAYSSFTAMTGLFLVMLWLLSQLTYAALIVATSHAYLGGKASFETAYSQALRVWPRLIVVSMLYFLAAGTLYVAIVVIGAVIAVIAVLLAKVAMPLGIIFGVVFGGAFVLGLLVLGMVATVAAALSYYACALEGASIIGGFTRGIQRAFGRGNFLRSLGVALALTAVVLGFGLVATIGAFTFFGLFHSMLIGQLFSALVQLPEVMALFAILTLFYYDLRVRNEGFDLRIDAAAAVPAGDALPD